MARPSTMNVVLIFSLSFMIMLSEFAIQSEGMSDYRSRSGKLSPNQRVQWRGDSGLQDGGDAGIDLTGGYYDAGDNVKFGFPMAFTISLLSWSNELLNALDAIQRGTDYLIKVHTQPNVLYGEVGDGNSDHACWQRPEDMTTPGTTYKIDEQHPGADLAGETMAPFAAASITFVPMDSNYSAQLLTHARQVYDFASLHRGQYQNSIPGAQKFYSSSGYELLMEDKFGDFYATAAQYQKQAEQFICNCLQKGDGNFHKTPGGLLWLQPWNNLQYTSTAAFVSAVNTKYIEKSQEKVGCPGDQAEPSELIAFAQSQAGYILEANPNNISYTVAYGSRYPTHVHHRGASIVLIKNGSAPVPCNQGYGLWLNRDAPDLNVLHGTIVGGPDRQDGYVDARMNYQQAKPTTINTAPLVGLLASLA
ncbi:hypothetical protein EUGRSUZ_E01718 [Eucalyptus grandis]|uniref:Uncharacterized protein n=2 Tax=Eucalyptus grandis TaxID=71139 RepID=A0ACC3KUZ6_EUCGR|nr:hypothetical protein EUGRSUZ_E01718 [Eucalyptus grandis]